MNSILASMAVKISANTAEFGAGLKQTNAQLKSFESGIKNIAGAIGVTLGAEQIFSGLKYGINIISEFEASMSEVKAITGATGGEFDALKKSALDLGAATKFTAKEVSQLQVAYGRLGFSTEEILGATGATLDLAAATGEDLAKSADVAGSIVRAFNLDASETIRVADVMASSFNKSALGLDNFGEAMKYVAPVAANAGLSLEQTTALLGVLADNGIRGSMAGTSLRKIISDLGQGAAPVLSKRLQEMAKAGLSSSDAMDEVGRTAYASLLILSKNVDKVDEATIAYNNAAGSVGEMASVMQDNLQGDVTKLTSAFEGMILKLSGGTSILRNWVKDLTTLIDYISGNKVGIAADKINQLAGQIRGRAAGQSQTIEALKELRRELGKPISFDIDKLTKDFHLTTDEAKTLESALEDVNGALSFDEAVIEKFKKFAQGYKDLSQAASEYNAIIRQRILSSKGDEIKFGQIGDKNALSAVQTEIKQLDRVTQIVYEYAKSKSEATKKTDENTVATKKQLGLIEAVNEELKKYRELKDKAFDQASLSRYNKKIEELEQKLHILNNTGVSLTPQAAPEPIEMPKFDDKSFLDAMNETARKAHGVLVTISSDVKNTSSQIKELFEFDLSPAISNAITGLADIIGEFFADLNSGVGQVEPFGNRLKRLVGGIMQAMGSALIALGIGKIAIKLPGPAAIAAGVALVAAGAALSKSASNAKSVLSGGSGSGGGSDVNRSADNYKQQPIIINVEGTLKGNGRDLLAVMERATVLKNKIG